MELDSAIKSRRSIRNFEARAVSKDLIAEIMEAARWSPSWGNTQPWHIYVVTGRALSKLKEMNLQKTMAGECRASDVPMPEKWPDVMKARYGALGKVLLSSLDIKREDKDGRERYYRDMTIFFDAPCLLLVCISRDNPVEYQMLDAGLIIQTVCLAAHDKGLGTCILAAAVRYPVEIRKIASIPDDQKIVAGIALGHPNKSFPLNNFERERASLTEFVHWVE